MPDPITIALSALVGAATAWLTSRLTALRAHDDRVWARKAEAYSSVLEALHELQRFFDRCLSAEFNGVSRSPEEQTVQNETYRLAKSRLELALAREAWALPSEALEIAKKLKEVLEADYDSWFEDVDAGYGGVAAATRAYTDLARRDLRRPSLIPGRTLSALGGQKL